MTQDDTFGTNGSLAEGGNGLEPLAAQVISMLCERQSVSPAGARQIALDYLCRAVLSKDGFNAAHILDGLRGFRLTQDAVIDLYIPQAAKHLGDLWISSDISFADVTVGALRLQSLLGEASIGIFSTIRPAHDVLNALIVVCEGEQHFLGACVVAAQVRRLGCEASLSISETSEQVVRRVAANRPDMVLMSCARFEALEPVAKTVEFIRARLDHVPVLALGGPLRGNSERLKEQTGVDLVTKNAADVVGFCTKRKKALSRL